MKKSETCEKGQKKVKQADEYYTTVSEYNMVATALRAHKDVFDALLKLALKDFRSVNSLVNKILIDYLEDKGLLPNADEIRKASLMRNHGRHGGKKKKNDSGELF